MFAPCPSSPNCVSSECKDEHHAIAPLWLTPTAVDSWRQIRAAVLSLPRTKLIVDRENYLQAECRSAVLGFIDDLELQLCAEQSFVAVRSAARTGYYDFGVNRRRVERLRKLLQERGFNQQQ